MGQPHFEVPSGVVDGVNKVFTVSSSYAVGSTAVWLNGVLLEPSLSDGWTESNPILGEITLEEAPQSSGPNPDVLQVFFLDTTPDLNVVESIFGVVADAPAQITGLLESRTDIVGFLEVCDP